MNEMGKAVLVEQNKYDALIEAAHTVSTLINWCNTHSRVFDDEVRSILGIGSLVETPMPFDDKEETA